MKLDARARRAGRGAYVCPRAACIEAACQRSAWQRALRRGVARVAPDALLRSISETLRCEVALAVQGALLDGRAEPREDRGAVSVQVLDAVRVTDRRLQTELESMLDLLRQIEVRVL